MIRDAKEIRLGAGETKTATARVLLYMSHARLVALIEGQWAKAEALLRERGRFPDCVFTKPDGAPLLNFYGAWRTACKAAGKPGLLLHDMRRSAARNLLQAGVPQVVAMAITGHKTLSIFQRYAIVAPSDVGEALGKVAEKESR